MFDESNKLTLCQSNNWFCFVIFFLVGYILADSIHRIFFKAGKDIIPNSDELKWDEETYSFANIEKFLDKSNFLPSVIIGGGCAGTTAATYLAQAGFKPVVFTGKVSGGAITSTSDVKNWPGEISINGKDLAFKLFDQAKTSGAIFSEEQVIDVNLSSWPYRIKTKDLIDGKEYNYITASCIISTGATPKYLGIPGEKDFWGKGVTNCAICDMHLVKDKKAVVIGGGDSALTEAITLAPLAKEVIVLVRGPELRAKEMLKNAVSEIKNIKIYFESKATKIIGDENGVKAVVVDTKGKVSTLEVHGVFLAIGSTPNISIFKEQLELDEFGCIKINGFTTETSKPAVFAAGDVTNLFRRQAIISAGQACTAALKSIEFLQFIRIQPLREKKTILSTTPPPTQEKISKANQKHAVSTNQILDLKNDKELETIIKEAEKTKSLVIIDFYATWCGPCKTLSKVLDKIAEVYSEQVIFCKINIDKIPTFTSVYNIRGVPTLVFLDNTGRQIKKLVGAHEYQDLVVEIENCLKTIS